MLYFNSTNGFITIQLKKAQPATNLYAMTCYGSNGSLFGRAFLSYPKIKIKSWAASTRRNIDSG